MAIQAGMSHTDPPPFNSFFSHRQMAPSDLIISTEKGGELCEYSCFPVSVGQCNGISKIDTCSQKY